MTALAMQRIVAGQSGHFMDDAGTVRMLPSVHAFSVGDVCGIEYGIARPATQDELRDYWLDQYAAYRHSRRTPDDACVRR